MCLYDAYVPQSASEERERFAHAAALYEQVIRLLLSAQESVRRHLHLVQHMQLVASTSNGPERVDAGRAQLADRFDAMLASAKVLFPTPFAPPQSQSTQTRRDVHASLLSRARVPLRAHLTLVLAFAPLSVLPYLLSRFPVIWKDFLCRFLLFVFANTDHKIVRLLSVRVIWCRPNRTRRCSYRTWRATRRSSAPRSSSCGRTSARRSPCSPSTRSTSRAHSIRRGYVTAFALRRASDLPLPCILFNLIRVVSCHVAPCLLSSSQLGDRVLSCQILGYMRLVALLPLQLQLRCLLRFALHFQKGVDRVFRESEKRRREGEQWFKGVALLIDFYT